MVNSSDFILTRFLDANRCPLRSKTLCGNTRGGSRRHTLESQCIARGIVPEKMRSLQWQFWAIFATDEPALELIAATGVSYSKAACEAKMRILESKFPNIAVAETFQ